MLTWDDTVRLLKVITAGDKRTVGEADIQFWYAAAQRAEWPNLDFAIAAVVQHAIEAPGVWLGPGHITTYWHELRREAGNSFIDPGPTRENIDDMRAQQIASAEARKEHLDRFIAHFVNPRLHDDPRYRRRSIGRDQQA